jgi:hypothetical protein
LEITDKDETKLTILAYFNTLAVAVETSRRLNTSERGICGSSDGDWEQDIIETLNMTSLNGTAIQSTLANLTQAKHDDYINNVIRVRDTRMITGYAVAYRTGGGYMLSLGVNYLSLILDFTYPVLSEVSIEIWVKLSVYETAMTVGTVLKGKRVLYSIVHQGSNCTVWYNNEIVITWGSYEINTGLVLKHSHWTHLSLTWRNSDGRLVMMLANIDRQREKSIHYGIWVNHFFYIDKGIFFGHDEKNELLNIELTLELDELRVWQFARKDDDIVKNMAVKIHGYIDGLVMFCGFDEGYGTTTNGTLYALSDNATTSGYYHRRNKTQDKIIVYEVKPRGVNPLWKPSGAPYPNLGDYEINFESDDLQNDTKTECYKLFYTGNLYKYCGEKLVTQTLFYYEACLMDVAHSGDIQHTKISVSMFAFYCQKVLAVQSCSLHGFYDGFPECEEKPGCGHMNNRRQRRKGSMHNQRRRRKKEPKDCKPKPPRVRQRQRRPKPPRVRQRQRRPNPPRVRQRQRRPKPPMVRQRQRRPKPPMVRQRQRRPKPPMVRQRQRRPKPPMVRQRQRRPKPPMVWQRQRRPKPPKVRQRQRRPKPPKVRQRQRRPKPPKVRQRQRRPKPPKVRHSERRR